MLPGSAGRELDVRKLYEAVQQSGGFEAAVSNKKFGRIAVKLGIDMTAATNAAYLLKWVSGTPCIRPALFAHTVWVNI